MNKGTCADAGMRASREAGIKQAGRQADLTTHPSPCAFVAITNFNVLNFKTVYIELLTSFDGGGYPSRVLELGRIALTGLQ